MVSKRMSTCVTIGPVHFDSLRWREAQRRFAVKWVFFIFILSLIEGPLRKWFLPGLAGPLTLGSSGEFVGRNEAKACQSR